MKKRYYYLPLAAGVLTPSLVIFILQVFIAKMSPFKSILDILKKQFGKGDNLFLLMVFSFIPFGIIMIQTFVLSVKVGARRLACIFWGGFIPVLASTIYIHVSVWYPVYAQKGGSANGALAFIVLPFLCLFMFVVGSLVGWGISYLPVFKQK